MDEKRISEKNWVVALLLCFFLGSLGAHRFYTGKIGTGFLWFFTLGFLGIGTIIDFIIIATSTFEDSRGAVLMSDAAKARYRADVSARLAEQPTKAKSKQYVGGCEVVGESYHKDAIASLGTISREYYWPTERLYEKFVDGDRAYKYSFDALDAELIPEPDNPHDQNAIRVDINGVTVGYIARDNTARIGELIKDAPIVKATITGGPYKEISETEEGRLVSEKEDFDFRVWLSFFVPPAPALPSTNAQEPVHGGRNIEIISWVFVVLAAICALGVFVAGIRGMETVFFAAPVGGAVFFGVLAWVLIGKAG